MAINNGGSLIRLLRQGNIIPPSAQLRAQPQAILISLNA
jgi:hypothetical protein